MEVRRRERGREFELDPARAQACETTRHGNERLRPFPTLSLSPRDLPARLQTTLYNEYIAYEANFRLLRGCLVRLWLTGKGTSGQVMATLLQPSMGSSRSPCLSSTLYSAKQKGKAQKIRLELYFFECAVVTQQRDAIYTQNRTSIMGAYDLRS